MASDSAENAAAAAPAAANLASAPAANEQQLDSDDASYVGGGAQLALQATAGTGTGTGSVSSHSGLILTACFLVGFVVSQALLLYLAVRSHRRRRIPVRSRVAEPSYWRRHRDHESKHEADAPQLPAMADHAQALGGEDHATVAGG